MAQRSWWDTGIFVLPVPCGGLTSAASWAFVAECRVSAHGLEPISAFLNLMLPIAFETHFVWICPPPLSSCGVLESKLSSKRIAAYFVVARSL